MVRRNAAALPRLVPAERMMEDRLVHVRISRRIERCSVLGPGVRAVIWVQGCPLRCPGCIAQETLSFSGGEVIEVATLAEWVLDIADIDGLTLSGGEPFSQADALAALIDAIRTDRPDLHVMAYSGHTVEELQAMPQARPLLTRVDLLVDGPYRRDLHADSRWRGSANQRLIPLTVRGSLPHEPDQSAGIEVSLESDGSLSWAGVPAVPNFRRALERSLRQRGFELNVTDPTDQPKRNEQ